LILGEHRTNNCLEGFHSALFKHCGQAHLDVWKFQHKLKRIQMKTDVLVRELREAVVHKRRKNTPAERQTRLCEHYSSEAPLEFMQQIAKTYS
jgi:hypothetical protein